MLKLWKQYTFIERINDPLSSSCNAIINENNYTNDKKKKKQMEPLKSCKYE